MTAASGQLDAPHCPACGYNLFGIESERCPECGLEIDRRLFRSHLPWTHRRKIGRIRAFRETVWMATFHGRTVAEELNRPVNLADARRFRLICVLLAWTPITIAMGVLLWLADVDDGELWNPHNWSAEFRTIALTSMGIAVWVFLMGMTALPGLFLPAGLDNQRAVRARTLMAYAAAPLAWTVIPLGLFLAAGLWWRASMNLSLQHGMGVSLLAIACIFAVVHIILLPLVGSAFVERLASGSAWWRWITFAALSIGWLALMAITLIGIPLAVLFVAIVVESFR